MWLTFPFLMRWNWRQRKSSLFIQNKFLMAYKKGLEFFPQKYDGFLLLRYSVNIAACSNSTMISVDSVSKPANRHNLKYLSTYLSISTNFQIHTKCIYTPGIIFSEAKLQSHIIDVESFCLPSLPHCDDLTPFSDFCHVPRYTPLSDCAFLVSTSCFSQIVLC